MKRTFITLALTLVLMLAFSLSALAIAEVEDNNTWESATEIQVNDEVTGSLAQNGDKDFYKVTITEKGSFKIDFSHTMVNSSSSYWSIYLYNETGVSNIDGTNGRFDVPGNDNYATSTFGVDAGTYYIAIANGSYYSSNNYSFTVNYTKGSDWESENNNSMANANAINVNEKINGALTLNGDNDWYKITLEKDGYFNISFDHKLLSSSSSYWRIYLYDDSGVNNIDGTNGYFDFIGNDSGSTSYFGVSSGTYYIKISNASYYSSNTYNFTVNYKEATNWETEKNNTMERADSIKVNEAVNGALTLRGDVDWYSFTVTENGYFDIRFEHTFVNSSSNYWSIYLYDETGVKNIDGTTNQYAVTGNNNFTTNRFGIDAGTYYIKITNSSYWADKDYNFTINFTKSQDWESEINNKFEDADPIRVNKGVNGALTLSGDSDWYKLDITAGGEITIVFDHETVNSSSNYWAIYLYDNTAVTLLSTLLSSGNMEQAISEPVQVSAGTYYLKVANSSYYSGNNYTLTVRDNHQCTGSFKVTVEPSCLAEGTKKLVCTICEKEMSTEAVPPLGHRANEYEVGKEPSCTEEGFRLYTCISCNERISENMPVEQHKLGEWAVVSGNKMFPPIKSERSCSACGYVETTKDWSQIGITIIIWIAILGGTAGIVIGFVNYFKGMRKGR